MHTPMHTHEYMHHHQGIFMIARCSPLFEYSPNAFVVITFIGAMTSFFAATIGILQNDLKRIIAYSTNIMSK
ncbi:hypothetical protein O6H91_18G085900 [Diphasiastrum complanatum]|uniref:Uncharacterized protein n=1 Tax=Diphasiastrum complanatum TaxID=34168 RepID=A0ACC2B3I9_DIPCM|nr:hypothetical protein O6H91_18G085900 [Diphasiastrum complanatum]